MSEEIIEEKKRVSPAQFVEQVKQEGSKVTWPTKKETMVTSLMVLIMTVIAAIFFLFIDWIVSSAVRVILGL